MWVVGWIGLWGALGVAATAQAAESSAKVLLVDLDGTRTVAKETCLARIQTKPGMPYTDTIVSEDIRRLYALGYFTDVRVETESLPDGLRVIFRVKEKPAVGAIEFQGNRQLRKPRVLQLLGISIGDLYDPRKLKEGVDKLKAEYQRKGYARADVATNALVDEAKNTATIYLVVDEGPLMRIREIFVEGNLAFPDRRILKLLKTKRKGWFARGVYSEQILDEDLERIRTFYRNQGYQDITVERRIAADPSGNALLIHLKLSEGLQPRIGQIAITGTVLFPERELRQLLTLKPGAVYSTEALQEDLRAIKQYYGDRGYVNAQVSPETQLDAATKRVNLTFKILENELVYVNRIDIRGNLRTKDVVIRRELRIVPGQPFNGQQIRRSIERLQNLGYFEEVNVDTEPTKQPDHDDLVVDVKEAKTGSFSFGGGLSSVDRLVGLVEVEQRNFDWKNFPSFTGAGQDLRARVEVGTVRRFFDLSFTEPWIFGYPVSFGLDAFNRTSLRSQRLGFSFEQEQRGGGIRLGKEFTDTVRVDGSYQLFRTVIRDVVGDASADLKAEQGSNYVSELGLTLTRDTRDNHFDPTKGLVVFASSDLAGGIFGGDKDFYRFQGGFSSYTPHLNRLVLETRLRGGIVDAYSNSSEVPIFERFFAGGSNTIRGFRERRVGPHDPTSNDPIGGEAMMVGTVEEVMTVVTGARGKPILKGSVFYDVGNVWRRVHDVASSFQSGVGVGARVATPIGPVRVDLGFPLTKVEDEKQTPRLHFNVSRNF